MKRVALGASGVLVGFGSPDAWGWFLELGPATQFASSTVDHSKYGARVGLLFFEDAAWSLDLRFESCLMTFSAVNPGAQSPSAPDSRESYSGDARFFSDLWAQSRWQVLPKTTLGFGVRAWLPQLPAFHVGFFPGVGVRLQRERTQGLAEVSLDYALIAATDLRLLNAEPEFAVVLGISQSSALRLAGGVSAFQNLRGTRDSFLIPRLGLTWVKDF